MRIASKFGVNCVLLSCCNRNIFLSKFQVPGSRFQVSNQSNQLETWNLELGTLLISSYNFANAGRNCFGIDLIFGDEFDIQAERLKLAHENVKRFGNARMKIGIALDDGFIDL